MAKRAPILDENYNPVGARLRKAIAPVAAVPADEEAQREPISQQAPKFVVLSSQSEQEREGAGEGEDFSQQIKEIKESYLRFRCTATERKKWHNITREITGEHNQVSHLLRACLLLLENSYDQMKKVSPDIQRMKRPSSQDSIGQTIYEQRVAQYLFDAIKSAGRPKG